MEAGAGNAKDADTVEDDVGVGRVLGVEDVTGVGAIEEEAFQRGALTVSCAIVDKGNNNVTIGGGILPFDDDGVTRLDADITHGVTVCFQGEVLAF